MKLYAPAKVNLSLRILGKRADGFHDLESFVTTISLTDEILIKSGGDQGLQVSCDDPSVPQDDSNLVSVAAREFHKKTGICFNGRIDIRKSIPSGAGLGGGSSNAATVLMALDSIFKTHLGRDELEKLAANIGSDVPFFIRQVPAWMRGRGEKIAPIGSFKKLSLLLIKPPFGVKTAWAYKQLNAAIELPGVNYSAQCWEELEYINDLERPVFEKYILLPVIKSWLLTQPECRIALMSGSGSTMYAICKNRQAAHLISERAREYFGNSMWIMPCEAPG